MLPERLADAVGAELVHGGDRRPYLSDETETRNLVGACDVVARPRTTEDVVAIVRWAYENEVPVVPRGGGTGYAGGAVPLAGGVVVSLERMTAVRSFDPFLWRMEVEAGVTTHRVQQLARENGLYYPPDPAAGEQSHIGGNVATNAGGIHTFKYGTTGSWVTGLEVVVPPGEVVKVGGAIRKDVAGYDLKHLFVGSEGTLGIVTAAWLRLIPAPEAAYPVAAFFPTVAAGTEAIEAILANGLHVAAIEYLDRGALAAAPITFGDVGLAGDHGFAVICEADGSRADAEALREDVIAVLAESGAAIHAPTDPRGIAELWRWREGMTGAVTAQRGGKVSEDIVVPLDKLAAAIERTQEIGEEIGLPACSWGHAGDGNLHSTFLVDKLDEAQVAAAERGAEKLFAFAIECGGSISGEHGIGAVKRGHLDELWPGRGVELHRGIKALVDPRGLMNPGKKC
jgi:glycolate oxidase subunit GlcD